MPEHFGDLDPDLFCVFKSPVRLLIKPVLLEHRLPHGLVEVYRTHLTPIRLPLVLDDTLGCW